MGNKLTEEIILNRGKASSLSEIKNLSLWGMKLNDISIVAKLPNVETVTLSVNEITTLKPFKNCKKLRELFLRKNHIKDLSELTNLQGLPLLQTLWLSDNPITDVDNYRQIIIGMFPNLKKLDEVDITDQERNKAKTFFKDWIQKHPDYNPNSKPPEPKKGTTPEGGGTSPPSKPSSTSTSASHSTPKSSQENILKAIALLMKELDADALDVLADQVRVYRASKK